MKGSTIRLLGLCSVLCCAWGFTVPRCRLIQRNHANNALTSFVIIPRGKVLQLMSKDDQVNSEIELKQKVNGSRLITEEEEETDPKRELDWENIQRQAVSLKEMALPYLQESKTARWLFAGMLALTLLNSGVSVLFSYVGRDFWTALSSKDPEKFAEMLAKFVAALVVGSPVNVLYKFQRDKLALQWREWMTDRVLQLYASNRVYYTLDRGYIVQTNSTTFEAANIDNPDQRIAEDIRSFTQFSLDLMLTVITSIIDLVSFSFILYSIQPQLFVAIIAYAAFGTITTTYLGKSLVPLNFENLVREADFRYSLVRIRDNAESIAFYKGEDLENREISQRLDKVITKKKQIILAQRNLEFFTTAYRYMIQILPVTVVAPQYFAGKVELGVVSQSNGAFNHILSDLSIIVNQFERLSAFSAGIERLSEFLIAMRDADPQRSLEDGLLTLPNVTSITTLNMTTTTTPTTTTISKIDLTEMDPDSKHDIILTIDNLKLTTPDNKRILIENLNLTLEAGKHLLIVGNSGAGKSSLLRAIAGLWTNGQGMIHRPADQNVYFLPQRPYCSLGSLRDQLLYPSMSESDITSQNFYPEGHRLSRDHLMSQSVDNDTLLRILKQVGLEELPARVGDGDAVAGLSKVIDWSNTLSLGEQQRLGFARLLVNKPQLCILDEATSALDMEAERKMYQLLQQVTPDATFVSVGHRPSLLQYHNLRLRVGKEERCTVETIDNSSQMKQSAVLFDNM